MCRKFALTRDLPLNLNAANRLLEVSTFGQTSWPKNVCYRDDRLFAVKEPNKKK